MRHLAFVMVFLGTPAFAAALDRKIEVHASIEVLGDIAFVEHSAMLTKDSERELDKVAETLAANPQLCLEVQSSQSNGLTKMQAQRRAAAVRAYFDVHGIDDHRLETRVVADHPGSAIELVLE